MTTALVPQVLRESVFRGKSRITGSLAWSALHDGVVVHERP